MIGYAVISTLEKQIF